MDMFINGMGLKHIIRWVAADANFRTPFMKFVMTILAGSIAKVKNRSDIVTLNQMKMLTAVGCVIGIYQEGERSWDGVSLPPVKGTDKLIRFLKLPVVYAHLEGAFMEHPRWSWSGNRTPINARYELIIGREEVKSMALAEITRRITEAGTYDEWAYIRKTGQELHGQKRAENLELICFICPECQSVNTMSSQGNDFSCSACGLRGRIDTHGRFVWDRPASRWPGSVPFETIRDWNLWQIDYYGNLVNRLYGANTADKNRLSSHLFWEDRETVHLKRGKRNRKMVNMGTGSARFYGDRIEFESSRDKIVMSLTDISAFSVFKQSFTEFYHNRNLYQFNFTSRSVSGYKWLMLFRLITEKIRENLLSGSGKD
jgi:1-acyl-sn-glycerol-3-phosphate acyltransferase